MILRLGSGILVIVPLVLKSFISMNVARKIIQIVGLRFGGVAGITRS
jgi:hypothetical protein